MKTISLILIMMTGLLFIVPTTQATFSIVAVDTVTGAIGGAGASCISGAQIINDIVEGIGAVHTQAYYLVENQENAHDLLVAGNTPLEIIDWLVANDATDRPGFRQYGAVTLIGPGASAGYTGSTTDPWTGHITGPGYAIQGNILLGPQIIADMETAFLNTTGPLEDKLMAALEAAKVPGADTRCLPYDKSAISAFIKVIHPGDGDTPYLDEVVNNTSGTTEPIDILWTQYNAWKALQQADADSSIVTVDPIAIEADGISIATVTVTPLNYIGEPPGTSDITVYVIGDGSGEFSGVTDQGDGTFTATITSSLDPGVETITASVDAGGAYTIINEQPQISYFRCGDIDNSVGDPNISDLTYTVEYLFGGGPPPPIIDAADCDGSGGLPNISDLTYLVDYLFAGGAAPIC